MTTIPAIDTLRSFLALSLMVAGLACQMPDRAQAQGVTIEDEEAARQDPEKLADTAVPLIEAGMLDQADEILAKAQEFGAQENKVRFLQAEIARRRGDLTTAVELYRAILVDEPDALRVRLELGRTYFLLGDDDKAELQFRYALAGDLPGPVVDNVLFFLDQIRARRIWSFNFNFALAPDTNVNAATNERQIEIFDLPFELTDDAREESGVGIDIRAGGRLDIPITERLRMRQTAAYRQLEYEGGTFDDTIVSLRSGPFYFTGRNEYNGGLQVGRRWFGGRDYSRTVGGFARFSRQVTDRLELGIGGSLTHIDHDEATFLDGPRGEVNLSGLFSLTPRSLLRSFLAVNRERADDATESNWSVFAATGIFSELPMGFNIYAEPGVIVRRFDEKNDLFGERRREITGRFEVNFRNRRIAYWGITPLVGVTFERRFSTIDVFDYDRVRLLLGVTREF